MMQTFAFNHIKHYQAVAAPLFQLEQSCLSDVFTFDACVSGGANFFSAEVK